MKDFIAKNKVIIASTIAFICGGLAAIGYGVPQPVVALIYSVLGLQ